MNRFILRIKSRHGNCCQAHPRPFQANAQKMRFCNLRLTPLWIPGAGILDEKGAFFLFETIHIVAE